MSHILWYRITSVIGLDTNKLVIIILIAFIVNVTQRANKFKLRLKKTTSNEIYGEKKTPGEKLELATDCSKIFD